MDKLGYKDEELEPGAAIPPKWHTWFKMDKEHSAEWRKHAKEDFDFVAGRQWSEQDEQILRAQKRPVITFNRSEVIIDAVSGNEINNRFEVRYIPRELGDAKINDLYTEAARWYDDQSEGPEEDSEAFRDCLICGLGGTESVINFDDDVEGMPDTNRIDPLSVVWDCGANKTNLLDARRIWYIREMTVEEAFDKFPDAKREWIEGADFAGPDFDHDEEGDIHETNPQEYYMGNALDADGVPYNKKRVKIVHLQYCVFEEVYVVPNPELMMNPQAEKTLSLSKDEFEAMQAENPGIEHVKMRKKRYKQAFIGNRILDYGDGPTDTGFSFSFVTGKRDRTKRTWYGIVRAMKDPQTWANKWLSQMLHIMNTNAKGGIMAEKSAIGDDVAEFERNWARPDAVSILEEGSLAAGKVQPKPQAQFPQGFQVLTEFAIRAIREVSGVSLEMLGLREVNQPGVLEHQRKQAGMAVLAGIFNAYRRYRKRRGEIMLDYIHNYLADDRMIKIVGETEGEYVPLRKQADVKYDVIVDESPTSPNQKEMIWASISAILPAVKDMITPPVMLEFLKYSPLPVTVVESIKNIASEQSPEEQELAKQQIMKVALENAADQASIEEIKQKIEESKAKIAKMRSETIENQAQVDKTVAETGKIEAETDTIDTGSALEVARTQKELSQKEQTNGES